MLWEAITIILVWELGKRLFKVLWSNYEERVISKKVKW